MPANVFVNEIHYDNASTDTGEGIEIAGVAGTDLTGWKIVLYDGSGKKAYDTITLSGTIPNQSNGFGTLWFARAGIQNGAPDGFALVDPTGAVVQFLSYEGAFTAIDGPAINLTSTDIGVSQSGNDAIGLTLQLKGAGTSAADFTWTRPSAGSTGAVNAGQTFGSTANQPGTLSVADTSVTEGNSGTANLVFTVSRTGGSAGAVGATYTITFPTTNGADSSDLVAGTPLAGTVSFADGQTEAKITIPVAGDTAVEASERLALTLSTPTGGASLGTATANGTIVNDDQPATNPGSLAIAAASATEGSAGSTTISFTVTRSGGTDGAVSATWTATLPGGSGGASASDFAGGTAFTGTVSFAAGQQTATITLPIAGDTVVEPNESFTVTLSAPTGGATIGTAAATGTIVNDDIPPIANVFINEIHYDNQGNPDTGERVEVAGTAGTDLTGWSLVLYNGGNGQSYATFALSGVIADQQNGFGTVSVATSAIQNGSPDGLALVDSVGRVIQFLSYEGTMTAVNGPAAGMTSTDIGVEESGGDAPGLSLQLIGSGSTAADFTWTSVRADNFGAINTGQNFLSNDGPSFVKIADARVAEGNSGTSALTFTVTRAGGANSAASVTYAVELGTGQNAANSADLAANAVLSGTVSFAAGEYSKQIVVAVAGDTAGEYNETLTVRLTGASSNVTINDGIAIGTIVNDDTLTLRIGEIQGEGHRSAFTGQTVLTTGIVTAVDTNGFYLQDPTGDGNARTSDGIFVFTSTAPTVRVGDAVSLTGQVGEYDADNGGLTVTQIAAPVITVTSSGNALPSAVLIGTGGLMPPTQVIDNDGLTSYDPATDGIDFWESLEGMRVTIDRPQAVSNTTTDAFAETEVVASLGAGATGMNARGGITISAGDYNPEKITLSADTGIFAGYAPAYTVGDQLGSVTGVVNYAGAGYKVVVTEAVTLTKDVTLTKEVANFAGDANHLSLATYNLENLDPTDTKFDILAGNIIYNLRAPDILGVQEIQDADGAGGGANLSGTVTAQKLIDAIYAQSGLRYAYVEVAPTVAGSTGGEPGGNIRNGFFYNIDRVGYVAGSATLITGAAYSNSRNPLVADFTFNGQTITAINVHFSARSQSDPLWGATQPPNNAGDASRTAQAAGVLGFVQGKLAENPAYNIAVLGDWNGFYFETAQTQFGTVMTNLSTLLPTEERYSYVFEGNAQQIDHILVTGGLTLNAKYDAVHLNAEFGGTRPTDHDPQVSLLRLAAAPTALTLADASIDENSAAGAVVGTFSATDTKGDVLTYSLTDSAGGLFAVDAKTGVLTATAPLDHEARGSYTITATVTDAVGLTATKSFTITVADVNEAPNDFTMSDGWFFNEDAPVGTLVGTIQGIDPDGDELTYTLMDDAGGLFAIDAKTGAVTTTGTFDVDGFGFYSLKLSIADPSGASFILDLNIAVLDAEEMSAAAPEALSIARTVPGEDLVAVAFDPTGAPAPIGAVDYLSIDLGAGPGTGLAF